MDNSEAVLKVLAAFLPAFPHSKIQKEGLVLYAKALAHLSTAEAEAAMLKCLQTSKFFPSVAEIIEFANDLKAQATNSEFPTSGEAWEEAINNARTNHLYAPWVFSCPEVKTAVERFGKEELCRLEINAVNTARAQFCRIYNEVVNRKRQQRENEAVFAKLSPKRKAELEGKIALIGVMK